MSAGRTLPAAALWLYLGAVGAGFLALGAHGASGAELAAASAPLPQGLAAALAPGGSGPTAVYVLHAGCPCAASDVEALARFAADAPTGTRWCVLAVPLPAAPEEPGSTAERIAAATGATLLLDRGGALARGLGATRSGALHVYRPEGALAFAGGLTEARGHAGPSRATALVRAALAVQTRETPAAARLPVRGCPLP